MGPWDASQCCSGMIEAACSAARGGYMQFAHAFNLKRSLVAVQLMVFTKLAPLWRRDYSLRPMNSQRRG